MYKTLMAAPQDIQVAQRMGQLVLSDLGQKRARLRESSVAPPAIAVTPAQYAPYGSMPPTALVGPHLQGYMQGLSPSSS